MRGLMLDALSSDGETLLPSSQMVRRLPDTVREQVRAISHVQAVMSVLEGYSNFLMHRAGRRAIRGADRLEAAMQQRRRQRGPDGAAHPQHHRPRDQDAPVRGRRALLRRRVRSCRADHAQPGLGVRGLDADARRVRATRTSGYGGRLTACPSRRHQRRGPPRGAGSSPDPPTDDRRRCARPRAPHGQRAGAVRVVARASIRFSGARRSSARSTSWSRAGLAQRFEAEGHVHVYTSCADNHHHHLVCRVVRVDDGDR